MEDDNDRRARSALTSHYDREWRGTPAAQPYVKLWSFPGSAAAAVDEALGDVTGLRVLDLASGAGAHALGLATAGARVVATELSLSGLQSLARAAAGHRQPPRGVLCDARRLPFADASFDLVTGENFLMYVTADAVFAECSRVLRPGGRLVLLEPTAHHPLLRWYRRLASPYRRTGPRYFSLDQVPLAGRTFSSVRHQSFYLLALLALPVAALPPLFRVAFRLLDQIDHWLFRRWPRLRYFGWLAVITCDKRAASASPSLAPE